MATSIDAPTTRAPLEEFVREYVETTGGVWDEIEPQVYDVLMPPADAEADERQILRITFDPEALPEHPGSQLASYGTPLIDRLLADALKRGRFARFYLVGLNLAPHDLAGRVRRAITLAPGLSLRIERMRPLHFPQAVFWFQAEFISDQKEQEILPVAIDLHYGRQVRHLEQLLDPSRLAETLSLPLPDARHISTASAYPLARERSLRTFAALANVRSRELNDRLERQIGRMTRYYADLRSELEEQESRARDRDDAPAKFNARRQALLREEQMRVTEIRQKNTLRIHLRMLNLVVIQQAKLLLHCQVVATESSSGTMELVWDPLTDSLEAAPCGQCQRPTLIFALTRQGRVVCPACLPSRAPGGR
jgi:hypothetical protein